MSKYDNQAAPSPAAGGELMAYEDLVAEERGYTERGWPLLDKLADAVEAQQAERGALQKLSDECQRLEAEIALLKACSLCGRPFRDNAPHINCKDTSSGGCGGYVFVPGNRGAAGG